MPMPRLPTACSCFLEPAHGYLARVRRSGAGNYLRDEQHLDLKSDPRLKHTFLTDGQRAWETRKRGEEEEEKKEKVEKEEKKVFHKLKRERSWELEKGRRKENHSFSNATLTNFANPVSNTEQKG